MDASVAGSTRLPCRHAAHPAPADDNVTPVADTVDSKPAESEVKIKEQPEESKKAAKSKSPKKDAKRTTKKSKKTKAAVSEEDSDSSSDSESSTDSSADDSSSDSEEEGDDNAKRHKKASRKKLVLPTKTKKKAKPKKAKKIKSTKKSRRDDDSSDSSSDSDSASDAVVSDADGDEDKDDAQQTLTEMTTKMQLLQAQQVQLQQLQQLQQPQPYVPPPPGMPNTFHAGYSQGYHSGYSAATSYGGGGGGAHSLPAPELPVPGHKPVRGSRRPPPPRGIRRGLGELDSEPPLDNWRQRRKPRENKGSPGKLGFKRVDEVWDNSVHNYKLQDTAEEATDAQYEDSLFHVRRTFDWEGKYKSTVVDIKSKPLRECLQHVLGNVKGVSLVEETPKLDPNMIFLYLEDLRKYLAELKESKSDAQDKKRRKRENKEIQEKRKHLKVLVKYLDKDYAHVKKSLYPLLENGLITYDLLWALWKPNTLIYTTTYGSHDQPRVFKVEMAEKHSSLMKGKYYFIEGKYFEFDGKQFGFGSLSDNIGEFRGTRKITSLSCYPLKYHKNEAQLQKDLIDRGKKFVQLSGVHYKSHQGMAYFKKKKSVVKVNINGRIMIDPSVHRRINPNYPISLVRPKGHDVLSDDDDSDDQSVAGADSDGCDGADKVKYVTKVFTNKKGRVYTVRVPRDEVEDESTEEKLDAVPTKEDGNPESPDGSSDKTKAIEYSDEEYLIASPVVLGFGFSEKLWLEFTVSGVKEIQWNEKAYDSLVLQPKSKDIVKALVESHKYHAAESIDDVIQGKGKGLVAVLHGPPGTGKTLTAEGISELLKCPLYMASAGELGTDSRFLEAELQKILDICHAWGAILLLDEADVFLEKRNMHDLHRNALVSIFLRQLEYFQGILFLTTNRVETFDDAFQSRIHIALKYDTLDRVARKAIFKMFVERVRVMEKVELMPFTEQDYSDLARHQLNGRQIKNTVRTAQALAVNKGEPLSMGHILHVLDVQMKFDQELKGGPGHEEAMRAYM